MDTYTDSLSDFLGALECAASDGDPEWLAILVDQATEKARDLRGSYEHEEADRWSQAAKAAANYGAALALRLDGRIADAMALEAVAGSMEGLVRAALVGV